MRACLILLNMIVEDERDSHTQYSVLEFQPAADKDLAFTVKKTTKHGKRIGRRKKVLGSTYPSTVKRRFD